MMMQNRTRSRSPNYLSPPREDYRERNMQTSVFDRMSSPPQRKHELSRRSIESNERRGNNGGLQILRTINGDERINQTIDSRFHGDLSQYEVQQRARSVAEPVRSLTIEETMELRNMRERLIAAETHCYGLETTVKNYEREIFKLRTIVNTLIDDFEVVQSRLR